MAEQSCLRTQEWVRAVSQGAGFKSPHHEPKLGDQGLTLSLWASVSPFGQEVGP